MNPHRKAITVAAKQGSKKKVSRASGARKATVAKAGRRSGSTQPKGRGKAVRLDQTYAYGRSQDMLKQRGLAMLDILQDTMHSVSTDADSALKEATVAYVGNMADINWRRGEHPVRRHKDAVEEAVKGLNVSQRFYAVRQFERAFRATRPRH